MSGSIPWSSLSEQQRELFLASTAQPDHPADVTPNFINPHHRADLAIAVTSVFLVLTTVAMCLRAYSQYVVRKLVTLENILGLIAYCTYISLVWIMYSLADLKVFWNHQWNLTMQTMSDLLYLLYILPIIYCLVIGIIKIAILFEWKKIFVPRNVSNAFSWTCNILIATSILFHVSFIIAIHFLCTPHVKIWQRWVDGTCRERQHFDLPFGAFNLVLDIAILALPQKTIWSLQTTSMKRLGISLVFSVGLLTLISSAGFVYTLSTMNYHYDVVYDQGPMTIWLLSECTFAILVFCVPTIPKAFEGTWIAAALSRWLSSCLGHKSQKRSPKCSSGHDSEANWPQAVVTKVCRGSDAGFARLMLHTTRGSSDTEVGSQVNLTKPKEALSRSPIKNGILMTTEIVTEYSTYLPIQGARRDSDTVPPPRPNRDVPWDGKTLVDRDSF